MRVSGKELPSPPRGGREPFEIDLDIAGSVVGLTKVLWRSVPQRAGVGLVGEFQIWEAEVGLGGRVHLREHPGCPDLVESGPLQGGTLTMRGWRGSARGNPCFSQSETHRSWGILLLTPDSS